MQGFCLHLLQGDILAHPDPARGRFRAYLRASFDNYLANLHEARRAKKRGGGHVFVPLDPEAAEQAAKSAVRLDETAYDREWARGVKERALLALQAEYDAGRRKAPSEVIFRYFRGEAPPYAEAAPQCGLTVAQFKASLHRARVRFRELLRAEVAQTVDDPAEVEAEMRDLVKALAS